MYKCVPYEWTCITLNATELTVDVTKWTGKQGYCQLEQLIIAFSKNESTMFPEHNFDSFPSTEDFICHPRFMIKPNVTLLIFYVYSTPGHYKRRRYIRQTWGGPKYYNKHGCEVQVQLIFVVGLSDTLKSDIHVIHNEIVECNDILLINMMENYQRIVYKGMAALIWTHKYVQNRKDTYIFKTDDDIFINIHGLIYFIQRTLRHCDGAVIIGVKCHKVHLAVTRIESSKIAVPITEFPQSQYPYFCMGAGYLMSAKALVMIVRWLRTHTKPYLRNEDIFYTGVVAENLNITTLGLDSGDLIGPEDYNFRQTSSVFISLHGMPENRRKLWTKAWSYMSSVYRIERSTRPPIRIKHCLRGNCSIFNENNSCSH
jgi:hypothetical protein